MDDSLAWLESGEHRSRKEHTYVSFARTTQLRLAAASVKASASRKSPDIRAKENIRYELTQPQNDLTPTGLLMEGQCTHPEPIRREAQLCRSCH